MVENSAIGKCFDDEFSANAIQVTARYTDRRFYQLIHNCSIDGKNTDLRTMYSYLNFLFDEQKEEIKVIFFTQKRVSESFVYVSVLVF